MCWLHEWLGWKHCLSGHYRSIQCRPNVEGSNIFSGFGTNCTYSESLKIFVMLCYAMYFTVNIIFINFDKHSFDISYISSYLFGPPEEIRKSISGPRPKKVVHHWSKASRLWKGSHFTLRFFGFWRVNCFDVKPGLLHSCRSLLLDEILTESSGTNSRWCRTKKLYSSFNFIKISNRLFCCG